ncbi:1,4-alpha-glucan branching protein GlgB [Candidatus Binatia bacterium]|nr:1,4-alpha-glucan branching protein GlgB [Candidatus Binatia bacterium]
MDTSTEHLDLIVNATHWDPFQILGPHHVDGGWVVRAFVPQAREVDYVPVAGNKRVPLRRVHSAGLFEARLESRPEPAQYRLRIVDQHGHGFETYDPYAFPPILSDFDLHLIAEGRHYTKYEKLGAHTAEIAGVRGVNFAVWAPNAQRVSVVGDFNNWDGRRHQMRVRGSTGVWELFVPGLQEGDLYKYEIKGREHGFLGVKTDPYGFHFEHRPKTAAIVYDIDRYTWNDAAWMERRQRFDWLHQPLALYEVHLGSWMRVPEEDSRWLTYRELAPKLTAYVKDMGFTHVELLPITEHPFDLSWGYQTLGYFAPTSRFGTPTDFMWFVDYLHQQGIGIVLDWTPAHFPRDAHGLAHFDGTALYEYADPKKGEQRDWGSLVFDYGRWEVRNYLISSALFWLDKYHVDGLRVDGVASMLYLDYSRPAGEWVPNVFGGRENLEAVDFLKTFNEVVHRYHPGVVTIAEESTAWPAVSRPTYAGGLGFSMKWNMGWMNDTLDYFSRDPVYRRYHHHHLTFSMLYAFSENFILPLSHDEVVHGKRALLDKMPGDLWQKLANLRAFYTYFYTHPGKKLLFQGGEIGQWTEWNCTESVPWHLVEHDMHRQVQALVRDLNRLYRQEAALHDLEFDHQGFEWIDCNDADASVISFLRFARDRRNFLVVVCNFTPVARLGYSVGVPAGGAYREALNSDSEYYGGSNVGNGLGVTAEQRTCHGRPFSLLVDVPPLGAIVLKPTATTEGP